MSALLEHLLGGAVHGGEDLEPEGDGGRRSLTAVEGSSVEGNPASELWAFWGHHLQRVARLEVPIDRAIAGGFGADRLGFAFTAGYHAALAAMLPQGPANAESRPTWTKTLGAGLWALSATEEGGAHPRAIRTALAPDAAGQLRLTGKKRWSTLAPLAEMLLVVASIGPDEAGRNRLRVVRVGARDPGVRITPMPATPFAPEIPHAEVELDAVAVADSAVLEGDGYEVYLKPFRTLEDVHVHGALLGYLIGVGRRHGWPEALLERLVAAALGARGVAAEPPSAPATHVALAGLLGETERLIHEAEPCWARVSEPERARWTRDLPLLGVAGKARAARREQAWARLSTSGA